MSTDPNLNATYFEFFNEIGIINQLATAAFQKELPAGFLMSHFSVLNHLMRVGDGRTPLAIANAFQVPKATMTHTLGILESHGLITIKKNPADGRSKCVFITPKGIDFRHNAIIKIDGILAKLSKEITKKEIATSLPTLKKIRQQLDLSR